MYDAEVDRALTMSPDDAVAMFTEMREGQWYERKSGRIAPRELAVPLVAMANAEGGCVVVGLHNGAADGVQADRVSAIRQAAQDFTVPVVRVQTDQIALDDERALLVLRVDPGERVHETARGDCYLRVGDESRKLGFSQRQELEYDRGSAPFDGTPVQAGLEELAEEQLEVYREAIGSSSTGAALRARSLLTRDGGLTVAAYLLFGARPQDVFPNAHVRVLRYTDSERGAGTGLNLEQGGDIRCEGSLPEQISTARDVIKRLMPKRRALGADGKFGPVPIIPEDAWLEGLVNAVLHRSYSMIGDHVRVEIFPDRVEISSPGRFPGLASPSKPENISRFARNPRIARACADLGYAQELGEGIRRIFQEMRERGLTDPIYTQSSSTTSLVLAAKDAIPAETRDALATGALRVLDVMRRVGQPLGTGQVADVVGMARPTASRHLQSLRDHGLVEWEGNSAKDPRAAWRVR